MAYQPTNPHPYMETIDATEENQFRCLINDRSIVSGAELCIYKNYNGIDTVFEKVPSIDVEFATLKYRGYTQYIGFADATKEKYTPLVEHLKTGATMALMDNDGVMCKITGIGRDRKYTRIYIGGAFSSDKTYTVYTDAPLSIKIPESQFPIYGGRLDDSWLVYPLKDNTSFLKNGYDYSWNVVLSLDEVRHIDSGNITEFSPTLYPRRIVIPYSKLIYDRLNESFEHTYIKVTDSEVEYSEEFLIKYIETENISLSSEGIHIYIDDTSKKLPTSILGNSATYKIYESDITLASPKYYFKARTTPEVQFDKIPEVINNGGYEFKASYSQSEDIQLSYYQFDLYQNGKLIDSSGQQSSQLIKYTFESFINQSEYEIVLTVVNDENVETVARQSFYVDYTLFNSTIAPKVESDNTNACIKVDYSNQAKIPGKVSKEGAVSFTDGGIHLIQNETVLWDERSGKPLDIPSSSAQVIRWHGDYGFRGRIIEVYDSVFPWVSVVVGFDGTRFIATEHSAPVTINGNTNGAWGIYDETVKASAIAGRDAYSACYDECTYEGEVVRADGSLAGIISLGSFLDTPDESYGYWIQVGNIRRKIIEINDSSYTIAIEGTFPVEIGDKLDCVVYRESYLYALTDTDELTDTDILIDNDQVNKYWWLIIINPEGSENRVEIRKSALYTESEV